MSFPPIAPTFPSNVFPNRELKDDPSLYNLVVTQVAVVGTPNHDGKTFHFRLSLIGNRHGVGRVSVRLDMTPSYTDFNHLMRGKLGIEFKRYDMSNYASNTAPFILNVGSQRQLTAGQLCELLINNYRIHRYDFTDRGEGCRHWCATVLQKLAHMGLFFDPSFQFESWEATQRIKFPTTFPMPRLMGTFY